MRNYDFKCPHCDHGHEVDADNGERLVTYHGDDGPVEYECEECAATFWVREDVHRDYSTGKTMKEARRW